LQRAVNLIASGMVSVDRLVTHVFPLEEIARAFEVAASEESLRVIVTP
jgi:threonine dehydrogenase-like Zn-dependent dehydrogenase